MTAQNQQIVELAKRGFDSQQIATALGMSVEVVTSVVTQDSAAVKAIAKDGLEGKFAGLEDQALRNIEFLAACAENEQVRFQASKFILMQRLGMMKPRERQTVVNNFQFVSDRMKAARDKREETIVDVTATPVAVEAGV